MLTACKAANGGELDRLLAVLRRFDAEAAREEARDFSAALPQRSAAPALGETLPMPEELPLLLVDCDLEEPAEALGLNVRRIEPSFVAVDLSAIERELAA